MPVESLEPLAKSRSYLDLAANLVQATPVLEAFFDEESSVMVMTDNPALRQNRLNLLAVLRNQAQFWPDLTDSILNYRKT